MSELRQSVLWNTMNKHAPLKERFHVVRRFVKNVLGHPLEVSPTQSAILLPTNGDGKSKPALICCIVTAEFLKFCQNENQASIDPAIASQLNSLKVGSELFLSLDQWIAAYGAGCPPTVVLQATHEDVLDTISPEILDAFAQHCDLSR